MDFINEMENMFLQAVRGAVEPALWEAWWDAHAEQLKSHLSPGYFQRIKPGRPVDYASMCRSQEGVLYYFYRQGYPVENSSDYYKIKAEEEFKRRQEKRLQDYYERISPVMDAWEAFLAKHPWRRWLSTGKRGWGRRRDRLRIRLRRFLIHPAKFRPCLIRFRPRPGAPAQFYRRIARRKTKASCTFA